MTDLPYCHAARPASITPIDFIAALSIFANLEGDAQQKLAAAATLRKFRDGDVIARAGDVLPSLMVVRSGIVLKERGGNTAISQPLSHLAPGDILGGGGVLCGRAEDATLHAVGRVTAYEIERQSLDSILGTHPELAELMAAFLPSGSYFPNGAGPPNEPIAAASGFLRKIRTAVRA